VGCPWGGEFAAGGSLLCGGIPLEIYQRVIVFYFQMHSGMLDMSTTFEIDDDESSEIIDPTEIESLERKDPNFAE
jgi:hypothetical protein